MMNSKFFTTTKVNAYVTRITGLGGESAYLNEGKERALLFDGLTGRCIQVMPSIQIHCCIYHKDYIYGKKGKSVLKGKPSNVCCCPAGD